MLLDMDLLLTRSRAMAASSQQEELTDRQEASQEASQDMGRRLQEEELTDRQASSQDLGRRLQAQAVLGKCRMARRHHTQGCHPPTP